MHSESKTTADSKKKLWIGRILSTISILFLLFDSIPKIIRIEPVVEATIKLGYPDHIISVIGIILFVCILLYIIPRTTILGAILLTGYLGGAVATQVRIESPLFSHILFPVYLGILLWGGIYLRNEVLKTLITLRKTE